MPKESGFTLPELMVSMAIAALIASIAIPNFIGWLPKHRLQSAALEIKSAILHARLDAIKANAPVVLIFTPASDSYLVFLDNGAGTDANAGNGVQDVGERTLDSGEVGGTIDMTDTTFGSDTFTFDARGLAGAGGAITLKNNLNQVKEISVTLGGISRIL